MKKNGFTLIEVMLTLALVSILASLSFPLSGYFLSPQEVAVVRDELQGSLSKAQLYSMTGKNGALFGVAVHDQAIVLFQGNSFATRDQAFDEVFPLHPRVTVSGLTEVVFARVTGEPDTEPTMTIAGNDTTETVTMNAEGILIEH